MSLIHWIAHILVDKLMCLYFVDLTTFQILGQKLSKNFVGILVQTMTPKGHFEINWPLTSNNSSVSKIDQTKLEGLSFHRTVVKGKEKYVDVQA